MVNCDWIITVMDDYETAKKYVKRWGGDWLREYREANGLSCRELARLLSVSPTYVSQVENKKTHLSMGTLRKLVFLVNR